MRGAARHDFIVALRLVVLRGAAGLLLALFAAVVSAQISGSVSFLSDYRYRGVSLSDNKPAAQLAVVYDDAEGWYAGLFASTVRFPVSSRAQSQAIYFAGHAWRTPTALSFETGVAYSHASGGGSYSYPELYAGFATDNLSGRLYFSPRYFGEPSDTLYGELNGVHKLSEQVRLLVHVGVLRSDGAASAAGPYYPRPRFVLDGRIGVTIDLDPVNLQLGWVGISSNTSYPAIGGGRRNRAVMVVSRSF